MLLLAACSSRTPMTRTFWLPMKTLRQVVIAVAIGLVIVSCSVVTSEQYSASSRGGVGIPYFLPVGTIHLQVIETTTTVTVSQASTPAAPKPETSPAASAKAGEQFNSVNLQGAAAATNTIKAHAIKLVETSYVPDPNLQFILNYKALATSEDDVKVTIGANGLLSKIVVTSEDKSGAIILKLIDIGKEVAKMGVIFSEGPQVVYDATFDPFDLQARTRVMDALATYNCSYKLTRISGNSVDVARSISTSETGSPTSGVAFRPVFAYNLTLINDGRSASVQTVLLPNEAQVMTIPITRAAFVKKVTTVAFDHGLLTEVDINKPSEMLAFMDIPLAIAKAIVDVPAELVQLKINTSKGNTDLANQQQSELQAQQALEQLRTQVRGVAPPTPIPNAAAQAGKGQP
jgi:hypothetical protein